MTPKGVRAPQSNGSRYREEVKWRLHSFVPGETPTQASPLRGSTPLRVTRDWGCFFAPIRLGRFYVKGVIARMRRETSPRPTDKTNLRPFFSRAAAHIDCRRQISIPQGISKIPQGIYIDKTPFGRFTLYPCVAKLPSPTAIGGGFYPCNQGFHPNAVWISSHRDFIQIRGKHTMKSACGR